METSKRNPRDVVSWRRDQLAATGFPLPLAAALAAEGRYDVHALIELAERGCPPELAARILAPLDAAAPELAARILAPLDAAAAA